MQNRMIAVIVTMAVPIAVCADVSEFRLLFNGKDLTGWTYGGVVLTDKTETPDGRFAVENGFIVAAEGKGIKILQSAVTLDRDFDLKLEFRAASKADSGVYVRGPQLQIRDFIRRKEHMHLERVFKNDDWNELNVSYRSDRYVTIVNGRAVTDRAHLEIVQRGDRPIARIDGKEVAIESVQITKGVTLCSINGIAFDAGFKAGKSGPIGLQAESGKFEFRNIRIRER